MIKVFMVEPKYIIDSDGNKTDILLPYNDYVELM